MLEEIIPEKTSIGETCGDVRDATLGGAAAGNRGHGSTFVFGGVGRHCMRVVREEQNEGPRIR
jgi:hypothetical protein